MAWTRVDDRDRRGHELDVTEYCDACWPAVSADTALGHAGQFHWGTRLITTFTPRPFDECSHCHREPGQIASEVA